MSRKKPLAISTSGDVPREMKIQVETADGSLFTFGVPENACINDVKAKVAVASGVANYRQQLFPCDEGKQLFPCKQTSKGGAA